MFSEEEIREEKIIDIAKSMMIAARTSPKARGRDNLIISLITKNEIIILSNKMKEMYKENNQGFFLRDSESVLNAQAIVLIGTKLEVLGLDCGLCGFESCEDKSNSPNTPCVFNSNDLGIAIGSASSIASDNRVDNRVMFSAGMAAKELGFFGKDIGIGFAIPLSSMGKNPFFDRQ